MPSLDRDRQELPTGSPAAIAPDRHGSPSTGAIQEWVDADQ
jgi:hypothetical protein